LRNNIKSGQRTGVICYEEGKHNATANRRDGARIDDDVY